MSKCEKRVAIVTGAAAGMGKAIALRLLSDGMAVIFADIRPDSDPRVTALKTEFGDRSDAVYYPTDISSDADRRALIDEAYLRFGRLDVLVNNAGIAPAVRVDLLEISEASLDRLLGVNLKGTLFLTQYAASKMIADRCDTPRMIINTASVSSDTSSTSRGEYCISKAAVSMTTMLFADRLAEYGINVYEIRPGIIDTDMIAPVRDKYLSLIDGGLLPLKRLGTPNDAAVTVSALASGMLPYSTGEVIHIDGGFHIRRL